MTITNILITPEGIAKGEHPEWRFPSEIPQPYLEDSPLWNIIQDSRKNALNAATERAIEFEDQDRIFWKLREHGTTMQWSSDPAVLIKALKEELRGLYAVDSLDVEVVEQYRMTTGPSKWYNYSGQGFVDGIQREFRQVLRITEKSK